MSNSHAVNCETQSSVPTSIQNAAPEGLEKRLPDTVRLSFLPSSSSSSRLPSLSCLFPLARMDSSLAPPPFIACFLSPSLTASFASLLHCAAPILLRVPTAFPRCSFTFLPPSFLPFSTPLISPPCPSLPLLLPLTCNSLPSLATSFPLIHS